VYVSVCIDSEGAGNRIDARHLSECQSHDRGQNGGDQVRQDDDPLRGVKQGTLEPVSATGGNRSIIFSMRSGELFKATARFSSTDFSAFHGFNSRTPIFSVSS